MIKDIFAAQFAKCKLPSPEMCSADELKSPEVFCVDKICDKLGYKGKRCDEIVLCDVRGGTGVYCIENKGGEPGNLRASRVCKQLQGGADIVGERLGDGEIPRFHPVLVVHDLTNSVLRGFRYRKIKMQNLRRERHICILKEGKNLPQFPSR